MLFMVVNALLFSAWFRFFFFGFFALLISGGLFMAKIWRNTPEGIEPVLYVSGLDHVQAWSLERAAERYWARGQTREGFVTYRIALANTPASLPLLRRFLAGAAQAPRVNEFQGLAIGQAFWLLRLSGTNVADLEITADLLAKYDYNDHLVALLGTYPRKLTPPLARHLLFALFDLDRMEDFKRVWKAEHGQAGVGDDPKIQLYRNAFIRGWDPFNLEETPKESLESLVDDQKRGDLAAGLLLRVHEKQARPKEYWALMDRLLQSGRGTLSQQISGCRLLATTGQRAEAVRRAEAITTVPANSLELSRFVQLCVQLDLTERAIQWMEKYAVEVGAQDSLWAQYAEMLARSSDWSRIRVLGTELRANPRHGGRLDGLSYLLEGWAGLSQNRSKSIEETFRRILQVQSMSPELVSYIAGKLLVLGYPAIARDLLERPESSGERSTIRADLLAHTAFDLKDEPMLLQVTEQAYQQAPGYWPAINNYAAALLITGTRPEKAITLTLELLQKAPKSSFVRVNHALALLANNRPDDARQILAELRPEGMSDSEQAAYYLARLEICVKQGKWKEASAAVANLKQDHLFPSQRNRVTQLTARIPKA